MSLVAAAESSNLKLVGLGGLFRELTQSFIGAETVRAIEGFYADRVVFSVKGISAEGFLTDPTALETEVKRAMIAQAATVVLVATARKFAGRGLNVIVPARRVQIAYLADPPAAGRADAGRGRRRDRPRLTNPCPMSPASHSSSRRQRERPERRRDRERLRAALARGAADGLRSASAAIPAPVPEGEAAARRGVLGRVARQRQGARAARGAPRARLHARR